MDNNTADVAAPSDATVNAKVQRNFSLQCKIESKIVYQRGGFLNRSSQKLNKLALVGILSFILHLELTIIGKIKKLETKLELITSVNLVGEKSATDLITEPEN